MPVDTLSSAHSSQPQTTWASQKLKDSVHSVWTVVCPGAWWKRLVCHLQHRAAVWGLVLPLCSLSCYLGA